MIACLDSIGTLVSKAFPTRKLIDPVQIAIVSILVGCPRMSLCIDEAYCADEDDRRMNKEIHVIEEDAMDVDDNLRKSSAHLHVVKHLDFNLSIPSLEIGPVCSSSSLHNICMNYILRRAKHCK